MSTPGRNAGGGSAEYATGGVDQHFDGPAWFCSQPGSHAHGGAVAHGARVRAHCRTTAVRASVTGLWPPGPRMTNSISGNFGRPRAGAMTASPCGISRTEWGIRPRPARAAAVSALRLPLVKAMRQARRAFSNVLIALLRVTLGAG